ncbi:MAG: hypothetical protein KJ624_06165 [Chloroflexi bacterium]|nr:hypothetical protein [Chloroflexota bacterium]
MTRSLLSIPILIMLLVSGLSCVSKGTYEKLATERTSIQSQLTTANASLASITAQRDSLNNQLTATNASLSFMTAERDKLNSQLAGANTSLSTMTADRDRLSSQLTSTNASLASMTADRDKLSSQLTAANDSLSAMTAERDKLSSQLTSTSASLASMTADRDRLTNQLATANASLAAATAQRDSLSSQLTSTNASLSTVTGERDRLNLQVAQLQGDYQKLYDTIRQSSPSLRNPTWGEVKYFLEQDDTNTKVYNDDQFDCSGFAITLRDRAWRYGFRSAYVEISFGETTGHALTAFQTTDKGLVYIDDTGNEGGTGFDCIGYVQVGQPYGGISLNGVKSQYINCSGDPAKFWGALTYTTHPNSFSYDYYVDYLRRVQFRKDSVNAYGKAADEYNAGSRVYSYSQLKAWYDNLQALGQDLGLPDYYVWEEVVENIEIYWN